MSATEVPIKFALVRDGEVTETRRVRLVSPTLETVLFASSKWAKGETVLQYTDDEGDVVTMDTEEEWGECLRLWTGGVLQLRLVLPSVGGRGRWWRHAQRCTGRSRSRSRSVGSRRRGSPVRKEDETATNSQQAAVVSKVLCELHGEDTMAALAEGTVTPSTLNCSSWLTVTTLGNGEVDLDVKVRCLYRTLHRRGLDAMANKDDKAVTWLELCNELCPTEARGWYNLACVLLVVRLPNTKPDMHDEVINTALDALEKAVQCGYRRYGHMATDPDLAAVRTHPRFLALLPERRRNATSNSHCGWGGMQVLGGFLGQEVPCKRDTFEEEPEPAQLTAKECKRALKEAKKEAKAEAKAVKQEAKALAREEKAEAKAKAKEEKIMRKLAKKQGAGVMCEREGCTFEAMGEMTHCCKACAKGKEHGKKCARNHWVVPSAPSLSIADEEPVVDKAVAPLPVPPEVEFAEQIAILQGMGFPLSDAVLSTLQEHKGDLMQVVNSML